MSEYRQGKLPPHFSLIQSASNLLKVNVFFKDCETRGDVSVRVAVNVNGYSPQREYPTRVSVRSSDALKAKEKCDFSNNLKKRKDERWILGLDGAITWDPYSEDDGIELVSNLSVFSRISAAPD